MQYKLDAGLACFLFIAGKYQALDTNVMVKLLETRPQLVIDCPDWSESSVKDGLRRFYQFWSVHMVIP